MKKIAVSLMLMTLLSKILGFFREVFVSYFYGTSIVSDAYFISLTIPGTLFAFIGVGISTIFIPLYNKVIVDEDKASGLDFMNNTMNFFLVISSIIVAITLLFTPSVVKLFASGFEGEVLELGVYFTRLSIFSVVLFGAVYVFEAFLKSNNSFIIPALMGIPFNVAVIATIAASAYVSIDLLPAGGIIAALIQLILLYIASKKIGYKHHFKINFNNPHLKKMIYLSLPVILGVSVDQINKLVDKTLASRISEGGVSALHFASRLDSFILGVIVMSIATVIYSHFSKYAAENKVDDLKNLLVNSLGSIIILLTPATVGIMLFAQPIVIFVFGRGAFDSTAISSTSLALFFYSIGMLCVGVREILARVFYSMQDTRTPMINAAVGVGSNIILSIILSKYLGLGGIALATSIAAAITTILMFISLQKKIGSLQIKRISMLFLKIFCSSVIMGAVSYFVYSLINPVAGVNLSLIAAVIVGGITYLFLIWIMRLEEVIVLCKLIRNRISRRKK